MIKKLCIILIIFESHKNIREIIILKMGKSSNGKNKSERVARGRSTATNQSETSNNNIANAPNQTRRSATTDPNLPSEPRRRISAPSDGLRRPVFSQNNFASHQDVLTRSGIDSWSGDCSYETENIKDMVIKIQVDENATKYNVRNL